MEGAGVPRWSGGDFASQAIPSHAQFLYAAAAGWSALVHRFGYSPIGGCIPSYDPLVMAEKLPDGVGGDSRVVPGPPRARRLASSLGASSRGSGIILWNSSAALLTS